MEQLLIKMARQLDALDEASLLALWDKYAVIVSHFEPTKRCLLYTSDAADE